MLKLNFDPDYKNKLWGIDYKRKVRRWQPIDREMCENKRLTQLIGVRPIETMLIIKDGVLEKMLK